jgi:hypothetical protein
MNEYPPGGLARTWSSSSAGRRRNHRRGLTMHMQYMRKVRSLSSRAVLRTHVTPNSLVRAGGRAPMSRPSTGACITISSLSQCGEDGESVILNTVHANQHGEYPPRETQRVNISHDR